MSGAAHHPKALRTLAAALLAACAAGPLAAQGRPEARVGEEVRVLTSGTTGTLRGELVLVRNDSLYVRPQASRAVAVPLAEVRWIAVRQKRSGWEGFVLGVSYGAPAGAATGFLLGKYAERGGCADECGLVPTFLAAGGLVAGTVLGAIIGGGAPGGRWVPAARPGEGSVALSLGTRL
ncbi:MAG: hypothetical protein ACJ8GN_15580 [Longimicrobiaceae bacterium]